MAPHLPIIDTDIHPVPIGSASFHICRNRGAHAMLAATMDRGTWVIGTLTG